MGAHPPFGPWSRRGLNPIKPARSPRSAGWPAQLHIVPDGRITYRATGKVKVC